MQYSRLSVSGETVDILQNPSAYLITAINPKQAAGL